MGPWSHVNTAPAPGTSRGNHACWPFQQQCGSVSLAGVASVCQHGLYRSLPDTLLWRGEQALVTWCPVMTVTQPKSVRATLALQPCLLGESQSRSYLNLAHVPMRDLITGTPATLTEKRRWMQCPRSLKAEPPRQGSGWNSTCCFPRQSAGAAGLWEAGQQLSSC